MSKNVIIQESGVAQTLNTISRVVTSGLPHGSVDWVPEDETQLGEISITADGEYPASASGLYAYSKVTVNAKGKAVGKDKNGNYKVITTDDSGNLIEKGLPVRIAVVTPPNKTSYLVGEPINIKGMVVKAYYEDDSEYGIINVTPDMLDPMVAPTPSGSDSECTYEGFKFWFRMGDFEKELRNDQIHIIRTIPSDIYVIGGSEEMIDEKGVTKEGYDTLGYISTQPREVPSYNELTGELWMNHMIPDENSYRDVNGTRVYYGYNHYPTTDPFDSKVISENPQANVLWSIIPALYGGGGVITGGDKIDIKWARDGDGQVLETSFAITVEGLLQ